MSAFEQPKDQKTVVDNTPPAAEEPKVFLKHGERVYETPDSVIDKIANQDTHIATIEEENRLLKEQQAAYQHQNEGEVISKVDKILEQLNAKKATPDQETVSTEELVQKAVEASINTIDQREKDAIEKSNEQAVRAMAVEIFGDDVDKKVAEKAKEIGMTMDKVNELSKLSPEAWKRMFAPAAQAPSTPSTSSFNFQSKKDEVDESLPPKRDKPWMKMTEQERIAYSKSHMAKS